MPLLPPNRREVVLGTATLPLLFATQARAELTPRHGFNDAEIAWMLFDEGAALARQEGRPIFLLAHTTWCPHCEATKPNFFDDRVVTLLDGFVPILIDRDEQPELNARYAPDGGYVPRVMVLDQNAELITKVQGPLADYRHLIPYDSPEPLRQFIQIGRLFTDLPEI